ncbi:hypothetical protein BALOs_2994 [Halobacteriovorax sp. BALOs_7]|uniref:hypothetical protein n=1 Tax=Halobacteriovorax sp. BALOs_7 TaxID=2109558 RepID=UPI000EA1304E|nr:hypothetical protein [Halobacteriovorax sp. BALOs_7]AYF45976.1 hypothetical protein BALOs_2994 [Halobacteriovorax sp. BALOs_7]
MNVFKLFTIVFFSIFSFAQSPISDFSNSSNYDLAKEKIISVSGTKRILLISNGQDSFAKGDYITILVNKEPVVRGIVPKQKNNVAAIKITKIYNEEIYSNIFVNQDVEVLRGDDSAYGKADTAEESEFRITDSESLYDDTTLLDEDIYSEEAQEGGIIKNDNLVSVGIGLVDGFNTAGKEDTNTQYNASWAFQLDKNIWLEGSVGRHLIRGFPNEEIDTAVNQYIFRAKYSFEGPLYTVFMPYAGYKFATADSPGAGDVSAVGADAAAREKDLVASVEKSEPVFGITALKRLVPGWFFRADIGTDLMGVSLALEF